MRTSGAEAYGQIAWSWLSLLQSSLAEVRGAQPGKAHRQFARTREAKGKVGSRESAPYAVKHRAGKAGRFRLHLSSVVHCVCIFIARRTSGCQPAPGLPCALSFSGREEDSKARAEAPRGGEGMPASHNHRHRRVGKAQACPRVSCHHRFGGHGASRLCPPYGTGGASGTREQHVPTNVARSHHLDKKIPCRRCCFVP